MQNWKTTAAGAVFGSPMLLQGLSGFFASMTATGTPDATSVGQIVMGLGAYALGFFAKDASTHSTTQEVQQATVEVRK